MEHSITIYSTPTCPYCNMAKTFLHEQKISFKNIDVSEDADAAQVMVEKSGQSGVPVIDIDGTIIVGFDKEKIKKILGL